jgi:putative ABC transport system substrate-binding protein
LPALAAELVRRDVAGIVTAGATAAALAAKTATSTIPIVFSIGADPVKVGLVTSLNRPGGNITGVTFLANMLIAKQLEVLREVAPNASVVGLLVNPNNSNADSDTKEAHDAARALGRRLQLARAGNATDVDGAVASLVRQGAAGLLVLPDPLFSSSRSEIVALAARHKIPAVYWTRAFPEAGGLLSYGTSQLDAYRQLGMYAGRVLKGAKPGDLPVLRSTTFELVLNLKTAKNLGLTVSRDFLTRVDEIIQ